MHQVAFHVLNAPFQAFSGTQKVVLGRKIQAVSRVGFKLIWAVHLAILV